MNKISLMSMIVLIASMTLSGCSSDTSTNVYGSHEAAIGETWNILFEGLDDGSFDMDGQLADTKLDLVSLDTKRSKDDVTYPESWKGYRLVDMLDYIGVKSFNSLIIVASDGYKVEIPSDHIDKETIIAIEKNGQVLEDGGLVQLVQNTQYASTWVKDVVKVIVKE